jgi:type I restriction enzyme, S subunit
VSELPPQWAWTTLGEATESTRPICYGVLKPGPFVPDGVPLLRIQDLAGNKVASSGIHLISPELDAEYARSKLSGGEVLLSIQGTVGRVAIAPLPLSGANISRTLAVIAPDGRLDRPFLRFYFEHLAYRRAYETGGTTRASLNISTIRRMRVPVPPLDEQRRIVAAIEEHLSRLDAADVLLKAGLRRLDSLEVATTKQLLDGGWALTSLGDLAVRITKGTTPTSLGRPFTREGVLFVKAESLSNGVIDHNKCARIDAETHEVLRRSQLDEGDVLVTIAGTLGRVAVVRDRDVPANTNQAVSVVRLSKPEYAPWVAIWLRSSRSLLRAGGRGVGLQNLNLKQVASVDVPLPPLQEQRRIVQEVEERLSRIDALRASIERAQRRSRTLRAAILERAFRGELVPQDPADEPAEALLARIRAEKDMSEPATGRRRKTVRP